MTTTSVLIPDNALVATETAPFCALCFTKRTTLAMISTWNHVAGELFDEAALLGLIITGPVQYIYTGVNGDPHHEFQLAVALPIAAPGSVPETFDYRTFAGFSGLAYTYTGHWEDLPAVYDGLFAQLYASGRKNDGHIREVYHTVDTDRPNACVTEIQIGLA